MTTSGKAAGSAEGTTSPSFAAADPAAAAARLSGVHVRPLGLKSEARMPAEDEQRRGLCF